MVLTNFKGGGVHKNELYDKVGNTNIGKFAKENMLNATKCGVL